MQPNNPGLKQPTENRLPRIQPTGRIIQPLSPEDDIRRAVEAASAEQAAPDQSDIASNAGSFEPTNTYEQSSLMTEPIHRTAQVAQPQLRVASPQPSPQSNKSSRIIFIVIGLIIVATLAVGAYFFLFNNKILASDLIQETLQQTTYMRPKQWHPVGTDGGAFGDLKAKDGKSLAVVTVKESPQTPPLAGATDAMYEQLRTQLLSQASVGAIQPAFRNSGVACNSNIAFKAEPDTKKTKNAIGLYTVIGSCKREDGDFTVKIRTVAGSPDGRVRVVAIGASNAEWDRSSEAFQVILDSIGQANN